MNSSRRGTLPRGLGGGKPQLCAGKAQDSQCTHHRLSVKNGKRKITYGKPDAFVASSIGANWRPNTVSRPAVDTDTTARKPTPASFAARIPFNVSSVRSCRCTPAFQMDGMGRQRPKAKKKVSRARLRPTYLRAWRDQVRDRSSSKSRLQ